MEPGILTLRGFELQIKNGLPCVLPMEFTNLVRPFVAHIENAAE